MRRLLLLALLLLAVSCYRDGGGMTASLQLADSLVEVEPDSALAYLRGLKGQAEGASRENRYRYQLLLAKAMNKAYVPFTSDSVMKEVADYYDHHGSPNEQMMAHYLLGCVYRDLDSLPQALLEYETAIAQADTTKADCDFRTLSKVYGQAAEVYYRTYMPQNTLEAARNYIRYGLRAKDSVAVISGYDYIADAYDIIGKEDSEIYYHEKAARLYERFGMPQNAAMSLGTLIDAYLNRNDMENALKCINRYERETDLFDENGDIEPGREIHYYDKGRYYLGIGVADSALVYFTKLKAVKNANLNEKSVAAIGLAYTYHKLGNPDSAYYYALTRCKYSDSILRKVMAESCSNVTASHVQRKLSAQASERKLEAERLKVSLLLTIGSVILLGLVAYIIIKKKRERMRQRNDQYERDNAALAQAQEELRMLLAESEEEKQKLVAQKQGQINQLLRRVEAISKPADMAEVERRIRDAAITERFRQLCQTNHQPDLADWHELREMVNKEIPGFHQAVNARTALHPDEYDICVLVRLRFKPKEIALLANINNNYVSVIRKRLLLKVFGETGSASDFDREIQKIYR